MPVDPSSGLTTLPPTLWPELTVFLLTHAMKLIDLAYSVVMDYLLPFNP